MRDRDAAPSSRFSLSRPFRAAVTAVNSSLRLKLVLLIVGGSYLIFSAASFYTYRASRDILLKNIELHAQALTVSTANEIKTMLRSVEKVPDFLARRLEYRRYSLEELRDLERDFIDGIPEANGCAVAFEPYRYDPRERYFAPYYANIAGRKAFSLLGGPSYDYYRQDWYRLPKELNSAVWSEPYFDVGGGNFAMVTYSVPFYRVEQEKRTFTGVVTVDLSLFWLQSMVSRVRVEKVGFAVIISRGGKFIAHPDPNRVMQHVNAETVEPADAPKLADLAGKMREGQTGFALLTARKSGERFWVYYAPLPHARWSMAIVVPERDLFADVDSLFREAMVITSAGFALFLVTIVVLANAVIRPLNELAVAAEQIAQGDLDAPLPVVASMDEIGALSNTFTEMRAALKRYIDNLAEMTMVRERIESELKIARGIQRNFLPGPLSGRHEFDIFAELVPAREVGGDLYDYYLLDDRHLFIAIGDVSDKGVPAALFMTVASALLRAETRKRESLSSLLATVNREICGENDACMFITLFCGVLDLLSGEFHYSNAGHPPPVLIPADSPPRVIEVPHGSALGIRDDAEYATRTLLLNPGDTLLLHTDGVTEAMNSEYVLFGWQRLLDAVTIRPPAPVEVFVTNVLSAVREHEGGAQPSDDVALLAVRFLVAGRDMTESERET